MAIEYSLYVLKQQIQALAKKKTSIETGDGDWLVLQPEKEVAELSSQISDLQSAIEILESNEYRHLDFMPSDFT
jgi:hypothetical protein